MYMLFQFCYPFLSVVRYLTADYERGNFSLSQCIWDQDANESIQTIHSTNWTAQSRGNSSASTSNASSPGSSSLTTGAIVGIVIVVVLIIACVAILAILRHYRKWPFHKRGHPKVPELDANGRPIGPMVIPPSTDIKAPVTGAVEADSKDDLHGYYRSELTGSAGEMNKPELAGSGGHPRGKSELPGAAVHRGGGRHGELYGSDAAEEVEGSSVVMELAGSPVGPEYYGSRANSPRAARGSSAAGTQSPNSRAGLSPRSPHSSSIGRSRSPISPLAGTSSQERVPSPLRQSRSTASGQRSAPRSPIAGESQSTSRGSGQSQGRGLGIDHGTNRF